MVVTEAQAFMCLLRAGPLRKLLCKMLFAGFLVPYFCHARSMRWFGGTVVRGCALRSLLGSYIHQESI